jgi:beta-glucosidase
MTGKVVFPADFVWGASTSSYQIEGARQEDGKGASIWDVFTRQPGKIAGGDKGDTANDHYHRMQEDVALMADLGLRAYRFSFAWPRIIPSGVGVANQAGLDFYNRLIDALLSKGIEPYPTMYHWDLPQVLQEQGGWVNRDSADWFLEYACLLHKNFGDRISRWVTFNEPWVSAYLGYYTGLHAPGYKDIKSALAANHHLLLAHGRSVREIRSAAVKPVDLGIVLNLSPVVPLTDQPEDIKAAHVYDGYLNRMLLDPLFKGTYPADMKALYGEKMPVIQPGDLEIISQPLDFLGINYYMRNTIRHNPAQELLDFDLVWPQGQPYSEMWEIFPPGLYDIINRVWKDYQPRSIFITENGTAVTDGLDADGRVRDPRRIQYLQDHLTEVNRAIQAGIPVSGYFVWSLMDNFEWSEGYSRRFGIVYVDYATQARHIKDSGRWYARVMRMNSFEKENWYQEFRL